MIVCETNVIEKAQGMKEPSHDERPLPGARSLHLALTPPIASIFLAGTLLVSGCQDASLSFQAANIAFHILPPVGNAIADQVDAADSSTADPPSRGLLPAKP
jgi:hypothetical protein